MTRNPSKENEEAMQSEQGAVADRVLEAMGAWLTCQPWVGLPAEDMRFEVRMSELEALQARCQYGKDPALESREGKIFFHDVPVIGRLMVRTSPHLALTRGARHRAQSAQRPVYGPDAAGYDPTPGAIAGGLLDPRPAGTVPAPLILPDGTFDQGAWEKEIARQKTHRGSFTLGPLGKVCKVVFEGEEHVIPYARVHHVTKHMDEGLTLHVHFEPEREDSTEIPTIIGESESNQFLKEWMEYLKVVGR